MPHEMAQQLEMGLISEEDVSCKVLHYKEIEFVRNAFAVHDWYFLPDSCG